MTQFKVFQLYDGVLSAVYVNGEDTDNHSIFTFNTVFNKLHEVDIQHFIIYRHCVT